MMRFLNIRTLLVLLLMFPWHNDFGGNPFPTVGEFEMKCINKKLLILVLKANSTKELQDIAATIRLGDRDILRLYYAKYYQIKPKRKIAKQLLELMPQGQLETLHFYNYTGLYYDTAPELSNAISRKEAEQAGDLYNAYFYLTTELLPKFPEYLERYLVMARWLSDNADMAEAIDDYEPSLRKAFGKRYDEEKSRIWGVLERPYDPPAAEGQQ